MAHEDTARELYEAIKPHVRVLTDGEMIAFNSHQIELLLVAALQAAAAEARAEAAKIANYLGEMQTNPLSKNLARVIADAIQNRDMLELNVAVNALVKGRATGGNENG